MIDKCEGTTGMIIFEAEGRTHNLDISNHFLQYKNKIHKPLICEQKQENLYFTEINYNTTNKQMIDISPNCNNEDKDLQTMETVANFKTIMNDNQGRCFICSFSCHTCY